MMVWDSFLQKSLCLFSILVILVCPPLFADLDDFGREVDEEQEEGPDDRDPPNIKDDPDTEVDEGYGGIVGALIYPFVLWLAFNISTYYPPFPYAVSDFDSESEPYFAGSSIDMIVPYSSLKRMRGNFRASGGFFYEGGDRGATVAASASGIVFGILWPEFEYRWWGDSSGNLHFFRLGGIIPVVQSDPFTLGVPMAAAFYVDTFNLIGFAVGGVILSYPVRPLSLEVRGGAIIAPELILWEIGGRISVYVHRFEIFTGYYGLIHEGRVINTIDFGLGINF